MWCSVLCGRTVVSVDAVGIPVLSQTEDIANARLRFANGCVANLTASRISPERMRKIRVFSGGAVTSYVSLDYRAQEGFIYRVAREGEEESSLLKKLLRGKDSAIVSEFAGRKIVREPVPIEKDEPLKLELRDFIRCVQSHQTPKVSGADRQTRPGPGLRNHPPDSVGQSGPVTSYGRLASHRPGCRLRSLAGLHHGQTAVSALWRARKEWRRLAAVAAAGLLLAVWLTFFLQYRIGPDLLKGFPIPWGHTRLPAAVTCLGSGGGGFSHRFGRAFHPLQNRRVPQGGESRVEMKPLTIMVVAGEPSGDANAAALVRALAAALPAARFIGAGGPGWRRRAWLHHST